MNMRRVAFLCSVMLSIAGLYAATDLPPVPGMDDTPGADSYEPPSMESLAPDSGDAPPAGDSNDPYALPPELDAPDDAGAEGDNQAGSVTPYTPPADTSTSTDTTASYTPYTPPADSGSSANEGSATPYTPPADSGTTSYTAPVESTTPDASAADTTTTFDVSTPSSTAGSTSSPEPEMKEIEAKPLFAPKSEASTVMGRKEMVADTDEDERQVRTIVKRIDDLKSQKLNEYLALDAELDTSYEEVGLARGNANDDIADIKQNILHSLAGKKNPNASDADQAEITKREKALDDLEEQVNTLTTKEGEVVKALKELSDKAVGAMDKASQMYTGRLEIRGVIDDTAAQSLHEKIKGTVQEVTAIEEEMNGASGIVPRLEKTMVDARAQMSKVKELVTALKAMDIDVVAEAKVHTAAKPAPVPQQAADAPTENAEAAADDATAAAAPEQPAKRAKKKQTSLVAQWTKGTFLEGAAETTAGVAGAIWDGLQPVRDGARAAGQWVMSMLPSSDDESHEEAVIEQPVEPVAEKPLHDPVLERIRLERKQSKVRAQELVEHRRVIAQKERLLDRLEAERVMQLDKKEDVMAELDRSYARTSRELSWPELGKRFMWKLYASVRRGTKKVIAWWRGEIDPITGRPVRPGKKKALAPQEMVAQQEEMEAISLEQPMILEDEGMPAEEEAGAQEAPLPADTAEVPAVPTAAEQEQAVAQAIAELAVPAKVEQADVDASNDVAKEAQEAIAMAEKASKEAEDLLGS